MLPSRLPPKYQRLTLAMVPFPPDTLTRAAGGHVGFLSRTGDSAGNGAFELPLIESSGYGVKLFVPSVARKLSNI